MIVQLNKKRFLYNIIIDQRYSLGDQQIVAECPSTVPHESRSGSNGKSAYSTSSFGPGK